MCEELENEKNSKKIVAMGIDTNKESNEVLNEISNYIFDKINSQLDKIRKKNLEKVIQQCQKTLDKIDEELAKPEPKLTPYDIEMRNFDEVPRGILKEAKRQIKIMMQVLDKNEYMPDYTYPLIDSYSIDTELCDLLFETKSIYKKYT